MTWALYAFASAFFAGITAVLAKAGIRNTDSNLATALRTVVVLVFAWAMAYATGSAESLARVSSRSLLFLVLSGLSTGASWLFYFKALQAGDVNRVAPVDKSSTILTMLLSFLVLREPVRALMVVGMMGIGAGTYLMIRRDKEDESGGKGDRGWLTYAILSVVFASLTTILAKIGVEDVPSSQATAIRTTVVLAMAWMIVFIQGTQRQIGDIDRRSWAFLGLSGLATGLSWLFYYGALKEGPASVVAPIDKLSILVTIFFARIFFGECLSRRSAVGLALLVAGTLTLLV